MIALETSKADLRFFRRTAFIGTVLLVGITLMNALIETGTVDYPWPRILIATALLGCAVGSYYFQQVRQYCLLILYVIFFLYNFYGISLVAYNQFQPLDTSATIIIGFALGTFFRRKLYLNLYLTFLLFTYLFFYYTCPDPVINEEYFFTVLVFILALGFTMFNGKIATMDSLSESREKLLRSEERFRNIFEKSPVGIILLDYNFQPFQINKVMEQMLGYSNAQFLQLTGKDYVHEQDYLDVEDLLKKLLRSNSKSYALEQRFVRKNGEMIWVRQTMAMIEENQSTEGYIVVMVEDITFQKKANFTLKEYASKLENHNRALEEFSYVVSHDLQEPLRMIRSYTNLIKRRYIEPMENKNAMIDMDYVIDGAERMSNLIRDMLSYSKWSAQPVKLESVDTRDVLFEVLKNLTLSIADRQAEVYCYDMPEVATNRMLLGQVLQNLIGNGLKYSHTERNPRIEVRGERRDFDCLFTIKDNGQGFSNKDSERIFGIFQRLHGRNSNYNGTGIGLAICKRIIEKQGGRIWAEGEPDQGAIFYFTLPLAEAN